MDPEKKKSLRDSDRGSWYNQQAYLLEENDVTNSKIPKSKIEDTSFLESCSQENNTDTTSSTDTSDGKGEPEINQPFRNIIWDCSQLTKMASF